MCARALPKFSKPLICVRVQPMGWMGFWSGCRVYFRGLRNSCNGRELGRVVRWKISDRYLVLSFFSLASE